MKDLRTRVISGIIGLAILIGIVKVGGKLLNLGVLTLSIIGLREFYRALEAKEFEPISGLGYLMAILLFAFDEKYTGFLIALLTMISLINLLGREKSLEDVALTILSVLYIPYLMRHISLLSDSPYIWLIFIIAFATDTFAYFAGNFFGKRKLCPEISPNKTIEGFIGGILGSMLLTYLYSKFYLDINNLRLLPLAAIGGMVSQSGDLVASSIKRYVGIKDYGDLIPGHGGVMDRFDSIIFTAPLVYYYIKFFIE